MPWCVFVATAAEEWDLVWWDLVKSYPSAEMTANTTANPLNNTFEYCTKGNEGAISRTIHKPLLSFDKTETFT